MDALSAAVRNRFRFPAPLGILVVAVLVGACRPAGAPRAILLVTVDTTRPDHLSAYGYARSTSPNLRRLASQGVRFQSAYTVMPTTDPSHTTMLTGLYPSTHGVRRNGEVVAAPNIDTLASWLHRRGYATGAVTARAHLDPTAIGITGFDFSDAPKPPVLTRTADQVLARVRGRLAAWSDRNWFLWVHLWEPHAPYDPEAAVRRRFYSGPLNERGDPPLLLRRPRTWVGRRPVTGASVRHIGELYDGEIAIADAALAKLVELAVDHAPGNSKPLVVVVSDHGEELGERQRATGIGFGHGTLLYEEVVHVAWVLWRPRFIPPAVVQTPVSLVDLAATVSSLVDADHPLLGEGRSLARAVLHGTEPETRPVMIERRRFSSLLGPHSSSRARQWARLRGKWKLIYTEGGKDTGAAARGDCPGAEGGQTELYNLAVDPEERSDRSGIEPERCGSMLRALRAWIARPQALVPSKEPKIGRRKLENLHALGYFD